MREDLRGGMRDLRKRLAGERFGSIVFCMILDRLFGLGPINVGPTNPKNMKV